MKHRVKSIVLILLIGVLTLGAGCNATSTPTTGSEEETPGVEFPDDGLSLDEDADEALANVGDEGSTSEAVEFELIIAIAGSGTVSPPYTGPFDENTEVTLAVQPSDGWIFDHWEGDLSGNEPLVALLMDGPKGVLAVFVLQPDPSVLEVIVTGNGTVLLSPMGLPVQTGWEYDTGTEVELTAIPDDDWMFAEWSGAVESSGSTVTIILEEDASATAAFEFLVGDQFSFLSIDDTDDFCSLQWGFNADILFWHADAYNEALADPECCEWGVFEAIDREALDMYRASTWEKLGIVLGEPLQLTVEQLEEVIAWNEATYPYGLPGGSACGEY